MSISNFYTETIILLDNDTSTGGYWSTSTGDPYSTDVSIKAAINLLSADEVAAYGKIGFDAKYKAWCAVSTEVVAGRRCRWNSDTFDIVADPKNTLQKGHHYKILLRDVT
jgi:head-tail adaptor